MPGAYALVTHLAPVTRSVLDAGRSLRIVGCCRSGTVNVNVAAATERGIPVVNAPGRNSLAVVEFTVGLILAERRGIARAHAGLINGVWRGDLYRYDRAGRELREQTIGLVGFGVVAQTLVPCLKPFGLRVLTYDPVRLGGALCRTGCGTGRSGHTATRVGYREPARAPHPANGRHDRPP